MGYYLAGFDVIGVDTKPQPRYPFPFIRRDALSVLADDDLLAEFDAIHASPPCQSETPLRHATGKDYPDLLTPTLAGLNDLLDIPWVIENVENTAKLPGSITLCGTHFNLEANGRTLRRHRRFLASFPLPTPGPCWCTGARIAGVYGTLGGQHGQDPHKFGPDEARQAMRIDWMSRRGLVLAIPPDYTRWIGEQLVTFMNAQIYARDNQHERFCSGRIERFASL
jgi:DNA (cytosine-5)-methyltransferase 1